MPKLQKCCVVGCNANNKTHRLFNFPRDDKLRELWLSFLIPVNVMLSGLSKEQLLNRYVCQKHFDRHQFDCTGNRLAQGYPCLFTSKEMLHGVPLRSIADNDLSDHSYAKQPTVLQNPIDFTTEFRNNEGDCEMDHNYALKRVVESPLETTRLYPCTAASSSQTTGHLDIVSNKSISNTEAEPTDLICSVEQIQIKRPSQRSSFKRRANKLTNSCRSFARRMTKMADKQNKMQKPFSERFDAAKNLSNNHLFNKQFGKMTQQAQDFVLMQLKMANKKKKAMRYTTNEKLLSLSLMKESPKGYRLLQKIFNLPSKRTLNRLAENIKFDVGLNENIFKLLKHKARKWDTKKKLCSILFDEVALTPHLTYVESQDVIRGFKDFGNERELKYCDHALVFMLKGVCSNWRQPISFYFCEGTTAAATVVRLLKDVISKVLQTDLVPLAVVCDQGSTFRTAVNILKMETERKRNLSGEHNDGTIEISGQKLSVVYDPPHLLKSIRNNLLTKDMVFKGKIATWNDIITIHEADSQLGHTKMIKKLTDHHVYVNKMKKMKVGVAAQALSETTSALLKYTSLFKTTITGEAVSKTMGTTAEAVEFIDKLFDSVNGSKSGTVKGKLRGPIKANSKQFAFWQEAKSILTNARFIDACSKRALKNKKTYKTRVPCLDGWIQSIESFERLSKLLLEHYDIQYFYPRNINQDPLENFFGRIRAINYRNVNPDSNTFINAFKSLLMSNVMGPHSIYANCEDDGGETVLDFLKLLTKPEHIHESPENKENVPPMTMDNVSKKTVAVKYSSDRATNAANERLRVHSSAYTAGYICRRVTKKINCRECSKTYVEKEKDIMCHKWIEQREYKLLKNCNLTYPSKKFIMLYREVSGYIHDYLNKHAAKNGIKKCLIQKIIETYELTWLGCPEHKENVREYFLNLIIRMHIHNWCNIINKILRGGIQEKFVKQMCTPQQMAFDKFRAHKKKINK